MSLKVLNILLYILSYGVDIDRFGLLNLELLEMNENACKHGKSRKLDWFIIQTS